MDPSRGPLSLLRSRRRSRHAHSPPSTDGVSTRGCCVSVSMPTREYASSRVRSPGEYAGYASRRDHSRFAPTVIAAPTPAAHRWSPIHRRRLRPPRLACRLRRRPPSPASALVTHSRSRSVRGRGGVAGACSRVPSRLRRRPLPPCVNGTRQEGAPVLCLAHTTGLDAGATSQRALAQETRPCRGSQARGRRRVGDLKRIGSREPGSGGGPPDPRTRQHPYAGSTR